MKNILLGFLGLIFISFVITLGFIFYKPLSGDKVIVLIKRKTTINQVIQELTEKNIIQFPKLFKIYIIATGGNSKVRAGEFEFQEGMSLHEAKKTLYEAAPIVHRITVPEGCNIRQIADILRAEGLIKKEKFIQYALSKKAAHDFHLDTFPNLEGFLFPDTYDFSKIDGEEKIVEIMVHKFFSVYDKEFKSEAVRQGYSLLTHVVLASIIEKETGVEEERPLVAAVFLNRIKKKMRLQSDPTTIYGIENFNGNLTRDDLHRPSPYNTYVLSGLPPGAISSPGAASLRAVLFPAQNNHLYFVATGQGKHVFSDTYEQHSRNVNYYQLGIRNEKRSK